MSGDWNMKVSPPQILPGKHPFRTPGIKMPCPNLKEFRVLRNYKAKAPPIRAPAMTIAAESNGSCSTAVAPLDLVDEVAEEDVTDLVALLDVVEFVVDVVEFVVELDTGGCVR
jgi:hypothetical protein